MVSKNINDDQCGENGRKSEVRFLSVQKKKKTKGGKS